jgi:Flp pilus assembly protein TadD
MGSAVKWWNKGGAAPALLALAILAVYGQTLFFSFVWDDPAIIDHMRDAVAGKGLSGLFAADYGYPDQETMGYWRPLTLLSLHLDDLVSREAWTWHAANLALYFLQALVLLMVARRLLPPGPAPLLAALFFVLWPPHVETVAFVTNRHDMLAGILALLSLLAWTGERDRPGGWRLPALGGGALFLGGLAKESALVLPGVILLWDLIGEGARPARAWWGRNRRWLAAWAAGVGGVAVIRLIVFGTRLGGVAEGKAAWLSFPDLLGRNLFFLSHLLFPWPLKVDYPPGDSALTLARSAGGVALLILLAILSTRGWDRWGAKTAAWVGVTLLPVSGLVPLTYVAVAEHHLYLPSLGLSLLAGLLLARLGAHPRRPIAGRAAVAALLIVFAVAAARQARFWRDEPALFSRMIAESAYSYRGHYSLGRMYLGEGRFSRSGEEFSRALRLAPEDLQARIGLGVAHIGSGRYREARDVFEEAARRHPGDSAVRTNLGKALVGVGDLEGAEEQYREAVRLDPGNALAWQGVGLLEEGRGRWEEASEAFSRAVSLSPRDAQARFRFARSLFRRGEPAAAEEQKGILRRTDPALAGQLGF